MAVHDLSAYVPKRETLRHIIFTHPCGNDRAMARIVSSAIVLALNCDGLWKDSWGDLTGVHVETVEQGGPDITVRVTTCNTGVESELYTALSCCSIGARLAYIDSIPDGID